MGYRLGRGRSTRPAGAAVVAVALAAVLGAGAAVAQDPSDAASGGTVKVGFISPVTGFVAALGQDMRNGWDLYWAQHGNVAGGVTVETIYEDDAGDPEVALTKARKLVEEDGVQMTAGPILANTAYAVADYVAGQGLPSFHITGADDLTQRRADPLVLRVGYTSSQSNFPAGQWAYDQGYRTAVTLCPDYAFGWESCGGFVSAFTNAGGTVTQLWHPLGNQDFASYMTDIQAAAPDVVFVGSAGGPDAILLYQTYAGFGLKDTTPLIGNCCFADQVFLREIGDIGAGIESFGYWVESRESPAVEAFVTDYEAAHNDTPSLYAAGSYMMAQVIAQALETTGGVVDGAEFVAAARGVSMEDSLYGPLVFDDLNNPVGPVYRTRVEPREDDGRLVHVIQETFPEVSQFWTYGQDAFLANPVFSRDFTGVAP